MKLWNWYVNWLDRVLPKASPGPKLTMGMLRWNLEQRAPGAPRDGARLLLTNQQCMELLAILNERNIK